MKAAFPIPADRWVHIKDPAMRAAIIGMINDAIDVGVDDEEMSIRSVCPLEFDAPPDVEPFLPGTRLLQLDQWAEKNRLCYLVSVCGRRGSELVGFTPTECAQAAKDLRSTITTLARDNCMSRDTRNRLEEIHSMLETPATAFARMQPVRLEDVCSMYVFAEHDEPAVPHD